MKFNNFEGIKKNSENLEEKPKEYKPLPEDHWSGVMEELHKELDETSDPLQIRATAIIKALGIPSGPYSALSQEMGDPKISPEEWEKTKEKDRIITKYLTNKAGVIIDEETGIVSRDFRDLYPKGLPEELKKVLDPATLAIMEIEYRHANDIRKRFGDTKKINEVDFLINYSRLSGGIDLFSRGYNHNPNWQENHGMFLKEINKRAKIICIEGFGYKPFGTSLNLYWSDSDSQQDHYDMLMREAVDVGFNGLFTEIDARDMSKIRMDSKPFLLTRIFPNLPSTFFNKYFKFLQREHPSLAKNIGSPENLKQNLIAQSTTIGGLFRKSRETYWRGRYYCNHAYFSKEGRVSFEPTGREFGQQLFSDALATIKLHLIAKLMLDGHIEKGTIIDYQGARHLSSKLFFGQNLGYAMQVVLRNPQELIAGRVKEEDNISEIYKWFENPDWSEVVKEITKLVFKEVENDPSKSTAIGPNQRKLIDKPIDFLKIYNINPKKVVPSDKEIKNIQKKFKKAK